MAHSNYQSARKKYLKIDIGSQLELKKIMCIILALCLECRVHWKKYKVLIENRTDVNDVILKLKEFVSCSTVTNCTH